MIPLRDENPTRRFPIVNYILIAVNVLVFLFQLTLGDAQDQFVYEFALIPAHLFDGISLMDVTDIFTSMFMHAGWAHIAGNMLYLWIFGDNIEDALGSVRYLLFYLFGGLSAAALQIVFMPNSVIPTVGASGAIAAVLGAYLVMFPRSRVLTLVTLGYFIRVTMIPAVVVLGLWFVLQFFPAILSIGGPDMGGVAYWAHVGGFAAGLVLGKILPHSRDYDSYPRW